MRWVRFDTEKGTHFGLLENQSILSTSLTWSEILSGQTPSPKVEYALGTLPMLAPVERPGKIIAIGLNYMDHCRETNTEPPKRPLIFTKFTTAMTGPNTPIKWASALTEQVDYEAELAVVIGKTARHISEAEALDYVFGYTCANDVSARDLQFSDGQWIRGKSLDTFCPIGPVLVTKDEIPNPQALAIRCILNGEPVQESNTSEMIFGVAHLISFASQAFTLEPGDIILTGTPHGTGAFRNPKLFMKHGDRVVVEIDGIGRLENTCEVL
ncbi:MAG: fumarylacetoacetate hydrolase family protein [Chloroflexi bacterium]|nr:fumarylacetoacetate hydrolase family protein [Chloroflexota bacterium]